MPGCHYDVCRSFLHFGRGLLSRLVRLSFRLNPFISRIPDVDINQDYADLSLDWMVGKMVENGFPSPLEYELCSPGWQRPNRGWFPPPLWRGDVYDDFLELYPLVKPAIETITKEPLKERDLPRDLTRIEFTPDPEEYPSKALPIHKSRFPDAPPKIVTIDQRYELPKRIRPKRK